MLAADGASRSADGAHDYGQNARANLSQCDEVHPHCGNCIKRKRECPGYRDLFDAVHKDETFAVSRKTASKRLSPPKSDSSSDEDVLLVGHAGEVPKSVQLLAPPINDKLALLLTPSRNVELESLSFFFSNYVNTPRDPSTNILIEHILPLYTSTSPYSPLALAINAVAINVTQMWMARYVDSYLAREAYGNAVTLLKSTLQDPSQCCSDSTIATVFLLDFYDSLNKRFTDFVDTGTHQQGAVALLRHRGRDNFKTPLSQRLFTAMRSRHINYCLQSSQKVQLDPELLAEHTAILPSAKLDLLNAQLSDLCVFARGGHELAGMTEVEFYQTIICRALELDGKLQTWRNSLPKSWQPMSIPVSEIHPSIRAAGVYNDMCDVYSSLAVSHVNNASRSAHVEVLRFIALSMRELHDMGISVDLELDSHVQRQIQEIVDRFCASVPYHLGNRISQTFPNEHREYPHVPAELRRLANYVDPFGNPVEMTMEDHSRAAAAIGGWFILQPLTNFLRAPALLSPAATPGPLLSMLRNGQLEWIRDQTRRLQKIYLIPDKCQSDDWRFRMRQIEGFRRPLRPRTFTRPLWPMS